MALFCSSKESRNGWLLFDHETKKVTDANPEVVAELTAKLGEALGW